MNTVTNTNIYEYYLVINNQDIGEYLMTKEKDQDVRRKQKGYKIERTVWPQVCKNKRRVGGAWRRQGGEHKKCLHSCICMCMKEIDWERDKEKAKAKVSKCRQYHLWMIIFPPLKKLQKACKFLIIKICAILKLVHFNYKQSCSNAPLNKIMF